MVAHGILSLWTSENRIFEWNIISVFFGKLSALLVSLLCWQASHKTVLLWGDAPSTAVLRQIQAFGRINRKLKFNFFVMNCEVKLKLFRLKVKVWYILTGYSNLTLFSVQIINKLTQSIFFWKLASAPIGLNKAIGASNGFHSGKTMWYNLTFGVHIY